MLTDHAAAKYLPLQKLPRCPRGHPSRAMPCISAATDTARGLYAAKESRRRRRGSARDARHLVAEQVRGTECAVSEPFNGTINVDIRDSVRRSRLALKVSASRLR
jgi:hypothetical protein